MSDYEYLGQRDAPLRQQVKPGPGKAVEFK